MRRRHGSDNDDLRSFLAMTAIILLASVPSDLAAFHDAQSSSLPLSAAVHPAAMQFSASGAGNAALATTSVPTYDEQIGATFIQNFTALTYNVTAVAQADSDGYGPAYILNGLTNSGYWYQVGISWHWPSSNGGYNPTFGFSYQVFGPSGSPVFPSNGGAGLGTFSKTVNSGDAVLLSLTFSGANVQMFAQDWATGATAQASYSSQGGTTFVGSPSHRTNTVGLFTGVMTEWYHSAPYYGGEGKVTYTNHITALSGAWLWADEFKSGSSSSPLFSDDTGAPVVFANDQQLYPFSSNGATIYGSAHVFITGTLGAATSRITLTPSAAGQTNPGFTATYTLAGLPQSVQLGAGNNQIEADSGTQITVSGNSSAPGGQETWVFSSTGKPLLFSAGSNVTYVYYDLVEQTVSYAASGGSAPASSAPRLIYQAPPPVPSSTAAPVTAMQPLGTTPATVFVVLGSEARVNGTVQGVAGERWSAGTQTWSITAPNIIPEPIVLYHQYEVSISYAIMNGGSPPQPPQFTSTSLGSAVSVPLPAGGATTGWFDAGSTYSFTNILNGSAPGERWLGSANGTSVVSSPDEALAATYAHQYYADLGVNDPRGGSVSLGSGWFAAGSTLNAAATANAQWKFEMWNGSGAAAYTGTNQALAVKVNSPLHEVATFYVQLTVGADATTSVALSYGSLNETVPAGTTKEIYVPPTANVTLHAAPSSFLYSFASWRGAGLDNSTSPQASLRVGSPATVMATSTYNYPVILGPVVAVVAIAAVGFILARRRKVAAPTA